MVNNDIEKELLDFSNEVEYCTFTMMRNGKVRIFSKYFFDRRNTSYPKYENKKDLYGSYRRYVTYKKFKELKEEYQKLKGGIYKKSEIIDIFFM